MMRGILSASLRKCAFIRSWSLSEDAGFLPLKLPPAWKSACTSLNLNLVLNLKLVLSWQPVRSGCFFLLPDEESWDPVRLDGFFAG